jgi:P2-related tail formation protein
MPQLTVQPSINDLRGQSLLQLLSRLDSIDLTGILVYRLDSAPDSALLPLAWQFDMLAPEWQLGASTGESIDALTDIDALTNIDTLSSSSDMVGPSDFDSLRALLKAAIPLHRTRGTPYSIKTALGSLGWNNVVLQEGQSSWGGTSYPAAEGWAVFRVVLNISNEQTVGNTDANRIIAAINFFKPVRCLLDSLWFNAPPIATLMQLPADSVVTIFSQRDQVSRAIDVVSSPAWQVSDNKTTTPIYNSHFTQAGISYGASEPAVADPGVVVNGSAIAATK